MDEVGSGLPYIRFRKGEGDEKNQILDLGWSSKIGIRLNVRPSSLPHFQGLHCAVVARLFTNRERGKNRSSVLARVQSGKDEGKVVVVEGRLSGSPGQWALLAIHENRDHLAFATQPLIVAKDTGKSIKLATYAKDEPEYLEKLRKELDA